MHKGRALAMGGLGARDRSVSPRHFSCTRSCISREDWTAYSKRANAPGWNINPNVLMLQGGTLAGRRPGLPESGPGLPNLRSKVAKKGLRVAKMHPKVASCFGGLPNYGSMLTSKATSC